MPIDGRTISLLLLAGTLLACHSEVPHQTAALVVDGPPPPPPLAESRFNVPLQYDFTQVLRIVERVVPRTFGSLDSLHVVGDDDHKKYAYVATRGPFTAWADGGDMHLQATLSYAARGWYKPLIGPTVSAGCGSDSTNRPRIVVDMVTPLTLTPTWHLQSAVRLAKLTPASTDDRDRCQVSFLGYDITDRIVDAARHGLSEHLEDIDHKVDAIDLTKQVTGWWGLLNKPIHLTDSVWLLLQPQQLRLGRVTGHEHVLTLQTGLDARPMIVTGVLADRPLPPLPPLAHDTVGNGFFILLEGIVDYATATRALTEALAGKSVTEAGHTVTVRTVTTSPSTKGRLMLTVQFSGDANGTLSFLGTPRYDTRSGQMRVPDLDYNLDTDSQLITAYAWLRSDALLDLFREKTQLPVAPVLEKGKDLLTRGLNRKLGDAVTLTARVDSVGVRSVYVIPTGIMVRAEAIGEAGMAVKQR